MKITVGHRYLHRKEFIQSVNSSVEGSTVTEKQITGNSSEQF